MNSGEVFLGVKRKLFPNAKQYEPFNSTFSPLVSLYRYFLESPPSHLAQCSIVLLKNNNACITVLLPFPFAPASIVNPFIGIVLWIKHLKFSD